jgi:xanthine dehydrogenase YagT iron-sulfur-binding subunit
MKNQKQKNVKNGMTRRGFIKGFGITSIGIAAGGDGLLGALQSSCAATGEPKILGPGAVPIILHVNAQRVSVSVEPRTTLVEVLRDQLHLTGTKNSCDRGACGACTVIIDGRTVNSCLTLAVDADGKEIQTVEGLEIDGKLHAIQESFISHDAMQCGFCTSGMLMSCKHLLDAHPNPTLDDVKSATSGNLCRCGTYPRVFEAVMKISRS